MSDEINLVFEDTIPAAEPLETSKAQTNLETIVREASMLSPEDQKKIDEFAAKINIHDTMSISRYGESAQEKSTHFTESALEGVRGKDLDEVGKMITNLVVQVKDCTPEGEKKGLARILQMGKNQLEALRVQYGEVSTSIDRVAATLKGHRLTLLADIGVLDKLFDSNLLYYKELSMYILAGKQALSNCENNELKTLQKKAAESGLQEDAQKANDLAEQCNRFEKRIYDLELTRTICIQMAPQIRIVQNTNVILANKIQTTIVNTIPLWKNQILLALSTEHTRRAIDAQNQVDELTNQLLRENSKRLKQNAVDAAKASERGIVDIETLVATNEDIITTLDEVLSIQNEGRQARREAEQQLSQIENELKLKLLETRKA